MKKKVAFSATTTQINPPSAAAADMDRGRVYSKTSYVEVPVSRAKEFEPFKKLPRFSHSPLGVISPLPDKKRKQQGHRPPNTLAFDGSRLKLSPKKIEDKDLPEHLVRPSIDEEALMKIREKERMRQTLKS
jgi:hypothetical protein